MILDALTLRHFQSCPRRTLLNRDYRIIKHRPKSLFDACLRKGIFNLSNGGEIHRIVKEVTGDFFTVASDPGLELSYGMDSWTIAKDYSALLTTILHSAALAPLLTLHHPAALCLGENVQWQPLAFADESGMLHRWITADSWTEDDISRELHSWDTIGDIAATHTPMTIHVVLIGQIREGRRASPWVRGWKHPEIPSLRMRFFKNDGSSLQGWKPVYFADQSKLEGEDWAKALAEEGLIPKLVRHLSVEIPSDAAMDEVQRQIQMEAETMRTLQEADWRMVPMSRAACDGMIPCLWQNACYSTTVDLALYQIRTQAAAAHG